MSKLAVGTDSASFLRDTWAFLHEENKVAGLGVLPPGMEVTSVLLYAMAWHTFDMSTHYVVIAVCSSRLVSHFLCKLL